MSGHRDWRKEREEMWLLKSHKRKKKGGKEDKEGRKERKSKLRGEREPANQQHSSMVAASVPAPRFLLGLPG